AGRTRRPRRLGGRAGRQAGHGRLAAAADGAGRGLGAARAMSTPSTALPGRPEIGWDAWLARAHLDLWLTVFLIALGALGLCVLYSASGHSEEMVVSQGQRFVLGLIVMLA